MWNCLKEKLHTTAGSLAETISGLLCHVYVVFKNGKILNANREAQSLKGKKIIPHLQWSKNHGNKEPKIMTAHISEKLLRNAPEVQTEPVFSGVN